MLCRPQISNLPSMSKLITIALVSTLLIHQNYSQSNSLIITEIGTTSEAIKLNSVKYDTMRTAFWDESTEGAEAIAYFNQNVLKLLIVNWYGEMGAKRIEYFFANDKLILAKDYRFEYNRPIYWDAEKANEIGDNEVHDPQKTVVFEDHYYFQNKELIHWVDSNGSVVDLNLGTNKITGKMLLMYVRETKARFFKSSTD